MGTPAKGNVGFRRLRRIRQQYQGSYHQPQGRQIDWLWKWAIRSRSFPATSDRPIWSGMRTIVEIFP